MKLIGSDLSGLIWPKYRSNFIKNLTLNEVSYGFKGSMHLNILLK